MAKRPLLHQAERVDLIDLQYGLSDFSTALQAKLMRSVYGSGVLDGFRIRIPDQLGSEKGHLVIYNGISVDWGGNIVNSETGTNSERIVLNAANMEYWIEIELDYADSDPDSRAFWDPLVDNTAPIPDGQEIQIPRTMTRQVPFWRVRRPIRSNPIGARSDGGYAPAHFSSNNENVIPIAVLRTNNQRQIEVGDANSSSSGNDIVPVLTQEDAINTRNFIKIAGYGESHGTATAPYGRKFSDQRPRMFNPLLPSFQGGGPGEVLGEDLHDGWARDLASVFDHLASQIKQIKTGAGTGDHGETSTCTYVGFADDFSYVDVSNISQNVPAPALSADPDQFIGCTFQITGGHWGGFYAQIMGNDRTDLHAIGQTRLFLGRKSPIPEWKELPRGVVSCQIVQHREVNWLTRPCPSTSFRGLNALDTEVFSARTDWHTNIQFDNLRARLNAGKLATLTVSPVDTEDPNTGEPSTITHPRADVFQSLTDIQTKVSEAFTNKGGIIHFRRGTYDFTGVAGTTAFSVANAEGFIIEGDGSETTILEYVQSGFVRTLFALSGCKNILFKDLTLKASGTPFTLSGCENIHFENCVIESEFVNLTTPTASLDTFVVSSFKNTRFYVTGTGIVANSVGSSIFKECIFLQRVESPSNLDTLMSLGNVSYSRLENLYVSGYATTSAIDCTGFSHSYFMNSEIEATVTIAGSRSLFAIKGNATQSKFHHLNIVKNSGVSGTGGFAGFEVNNMDACSIDNIYMLSLNGGMYVTGDMTRSSISNFRTFLSSNAFGVRVDGLFSNSLIGNNSIVTSGSTAIGVKIQGNTANSFIINNDFNNTSQIDKCIEITSSGLTNVVIQGNTMSRASYGLYFTGVSGGHRIFVKDNAAHEIGTDAYFMKLESDLQNCIFSGNSATLVSGCGITIDSTGVNISKCLFHDNNFNCTGRAFDIWSTSGGQMYDSSILGNNFQSVSRSAFAVGHAARNGNPASGASAYVVSNCLIKNNLVNTTESSTLTYYSLYVSYLWVSVVDNNYVAGGNETSSLYVEKGVLSSSVSYNTVVAAVGSGSHGIHLKGSVMDDSIINGNRVYTVGTGHLGIYINQDNPPTNKARRLNIQGNILKTQSLVDANGIHIDSAEHCNVTNNTSYNFGTGIRMRLCNRCLINSNLTVNCNTGIDLQTGLDSMVSGNLLVNCSGPFIDVTGATNMRGGMSASAPAPDPNWPNDDGSVNNIRAFNVGI